MELGLLFVGVLLMVGVFVVITALAADPADIDEEEAASIKNQLPEDRERPTPRRSASRDAITELSKADPEDTISGD